MNEPKIYSATAKGKKRTGFLSDEAFFYLNDKGIIDWVLKRQVTDLTPLTLATPEDVVIDALGAIVIRTAIQEGLEELTKLESRLFPRNLETSNLRGCFYALRQKFPRTFIQLSQEVGEEGAPGVNEAAYKKIVEYSERDTPSPSPSESAKVENDSVFFDGVQSGDVLLIENLIGKYNLAGFKEIVELILDKDEYAFSGKRRIRTVPEVDLSRLAEFEGYIKQAGDKGTIEFWREIKKSIYKPVKDWLDSQLSPMPEPTNVVGEVCKNEPKGVGAVIKTGTGNIWARRHEAQDEPWVGLAHFHLVFNSWKNLSGYSPVLLLEGNPKRVGE